MNMPAGCKRLGLVLLTAWFFAAAPVAHQANAEDDNPSGQYIDDGTIEGFSIGFGTTYGYDYCDAPSLGDRLRKVWWRLLDYCDLLPQQKAALHGLFEETTKEAAPVLADLKAGRPLPAYALSPEEVQRRMAEMGFECENASYREKSADMEVLLDRIDQGHARPDAILTGACTK